MSTAQLSDEQVCELGAKLKAAREALTKDISDAAYRIALSPSQLRALESGDRRPFYSTHYFLQACERYARFLGVTAAEIEAYRAQIQSSALSRNDVPIEDLPEPPAAAPHAFTHTASTPMVANKPAPAAASNDDFNAPKRAFHKRLSPAALAFFAAVIVLVAVISLKQDPPTLNMASAPMPAAAPDAANTPAPAQEQAPASGGLTSAAIASTATSTSTAAATASPTPAASSSSDKDSYIESTAGAWIQIVSRSGEKTNQRIIAGDKLAFVSSETAAVVIGQPEKATLTVRGKSVDLRQYSSSSSEGATRALVIISNIPR